MPTCPASCLVHRCTDLKGRSRTSYRKRLIAISLSKSLKNITVLMLSKNNLKYTIVAERNVDSGMSLEKSLLWLNFYSNCWAVNKGYVAWNASCVRHF